MPDIDWKAKYEALRESIGETVGTLQRRLDQELQAHKDTRESVDDLRRKHAVALDGVHKEHAVALKAQAAQLLADTPENRSRRERLAALRRKQAEETRALEAELKT